MNRLLSGQQRMQLFTAGCPPCTGHPTASPPCTGHPTASPQHSLTNERTPQAADVVGIPSGTAVLLAVDLSTDSPQQYRIGSAVCSRGCDGKCRTGCEGKCRQKAEQQWPGPVTDAGSWVHKTLTSCAAGGCMMLCDHSCHPMHTPAHPVYDVPVLDARGLAINCRPGRGMAAGVDR